MSVTLAWPWLRHSAQGQQDLARYAPLREGGARLMAVYEDDGERHAWKSENVAVVPALRILSDLRPPVAEAMMLGQITGGNPAKQLAAKPDVVKRLTIYRDKLAALITLGLGFEACAKTDLFDKALSLQERYGLLTNDSVIAAIALRLEADALVSADMRFKAVKDLTLYAPSDLKQA